MSWQTKLSVKGQVVIPKDVRDSLGLKPGETLNVKKVGNQVVMEAVKALSPKISYSEFRKLVPKYEGPPLSIEDMNLAVDAMFAQKHR